MLSKKDISGVLLLCMVTVSVSVVVNYLSPVGIAWFGNWDKSKGVVSAQAKNELIEHGIEINDPIEMKKLVESGHLPIIDVRPMEQYQKGHIPGAVSMPLSEFDNIIDQLFETMAPDAVMILYCSGRECEDSHTFARQLKALGYTNMKVYSGGMSEWEEQRFKIETNE